MATRVIPRLTARRVRWAAAVAVLAVVAIVALVASRDGGDSSTAAGRPALATRTVQAGKVTVKVEPRRLTADGATFHIAFDTHAVALDFDVAEQAKLVVGTTTWTTAAWSGDGPGGHHREGDLRFRATGPATGVATLTLGGLPEPATTTWTLSS